MPHQKTSYKILIDSEDFVNRGFMATVIGLAKGLRKYIPNIKIIVFSGYPVWDKRLSKFGIEIRQHPWLGRNHGLLGKIRYVILYLCDFLRCLVLRLAGKFNPHIKCPYDQYAAFIHFQNNLCNNNNTIWFLQYLTTLFLTLSICPRPAVTLPVTLGPFSNRLTRWLTKFVLNRMDILVLRDETSYNYAHNLGLSKPRIFLAADPAFLLDPAPKGRVREILKTEGITRNNKILFGFSPRHYLARFTVFGRSLNRREEQLRYVNILAQLVDYLVDQFESVVFLIPQVYNPQVYNSDDRRMHYQIYRQVRHKSLVKLFRGEYLSDELKGIIGNCDMFFSGYLHGAIASISMGIPTITIACADKFQRLIGRTMGQEKYIIDIRNLESDEFVGEFKLKVDSLWADKERLRVEMGTRTKSAQQHAWSYAKLLDGLIHEKHS